MKCHRKTKKEKSSQNRSSFCINLIPLTKFLDVLYCTFSIMLPLGPLPSKSNAYWAYFVFNFRLVRGGHFSISVRHCYVRTADREIAAFDILRKLVLPELVSHWIHFDRCSVAWWLNPPESLLVWDNFLHFFFVSFPRRLFGVSLRISMTYHGRITFCPFSMQTKQSICLTGHQW